MPCILVNNYGRFGRARCLHLYILKSVCYLVCDLYEAFDLFRNLLCLSLFYTIFLQFALLEIFPSLTKVFLCALLVAFFLVKIKLIFFFYNLFY